MDAYLTLKKQFEKNQDPKKAVQMAAYMRYLFPFYGV